MSLSNRDGCIRSTRKRAALGAAVGLRVSAAVISLLLTGCSLMPGGSTPQARWLSDGSLGLSRPVPPAQSSARASLSPSVLSAESPAEGIQLIVSRRDQTLTALRPGEKPLILKADGAQFLPAGSFSITAREVAPLWYAPTSYFVHRGLPTPAEGSRERFKRAALGSHALYLNNQLPIHSGPVWLKDIGGIRVVQKDMSELFSFVSVGTRIDVR